jgi:hydrogenase nickel incorporation protein HypA/HybF
VHEYSIVAELVRHVEVEAERAGARSVTRVTVAIGDLSGVERDLLATAYGVFREQTVCAGAELDVRAVPAVWSCPACRREMPRGAVLRCMRCGLPAKLTQGEEIVLERIEMEVG